MQGTLLNVTWQPGWERGSEGNGYMYVCMAEFLGCSPETIQHCLLVGSTPIQNKIPEGKCSGKEANVEQRKGLGISN